MFMQSARDNVQQTCAGDRQEMDKIEREREINWLWDQERKTAETIVWKTLKKINLVNIMINISQVC